MMFERSSPEGTTLIVLNNTYVPRRLALPVHLTGGRVVDVLRGTAVEVVGGELRFDLLPARSSVILSATTVGDRTASRDVVVS